MDNWVSVFVAIAVAATAFMVMWLRVKDHKILMHDPFMLSRESRRLLEIGIETNNHIKLEPTGNGTLICVGEETFPTSTHAKPLAVLMTYGLVVWDEGYNGGSHCVTIWAESWMAQSSERKWWEWLFYALRDQYTSRAARQREKREGNGSD